MPPARAQAGYAAEKIATTLSTARNTHGTSTRSVVIPTMRDLGIVIAQIEDTSPSTVAMIANGEYTRPA